MRCCPKGDFLPFSRVFRPIFGVVIDIRVVLTPNPPRLHLADPFPFPIADVLYGLPILQPMILGAFDHIAKIVAGRLSLNADTNIIWLLIIIYGTCFCLCTRLYHVYQKPVILEQLHNFSEDMIPVRQQHIVAVDSSNIPGRLRWKICCCCCSVRCWVIQRSDVDRVGSSGDTTHKISCNASHWKRKYILNRK